MDKTDDETEEVRKSCGGKKVANYGCCVPGSQGR